MSFKVRSIKRASSSSGQRFFSRSHVKMLFAIGGLFVVTYFVQALMGGGSLTRIIKPPSALKTDENGHTNFILLGVAGTTEEGGNLSDSIMMASLDSENGRLSLLNLPRDLFVSSSIGDRKINEIYARARYKSKSDIKGLSVIKKAVADLSGIDVHYGVVIDFRMFEDMIDAFGGVELFVPEDIVDPFYPDDNYAYQTFTIRKGKQTLTGDIALKYARSRKTTSDYDRAKRQQMILQALVEKAINDGVLSDREKVKDLYHLYKKHIVTDLNLVETLAFAKRLLGLSMDTAHLTSRVLNDDPSEPGGMLYTPAQEFYGGQYVLLPKSLADTQLFFHITLGDMDILAEKGQIGVFNGSKINGWATKNAQRLRRLGLHVIDVGNFPTETPVFRTYVRDLSGGTKPKTVEILNKIYDFHSIEVVPPEEIPEDNLLDFEIILGTN